MSLGFDKFYDCVFDEFPLLEPTFLVGSTASLTVLRKQMGAQRPGDPDTPGLGSAMASRHRDMRSLPPANTIVPSEVQRKALERPVSKAGLYRHGFLSSSQLESFRLFS